MGASPLALLRTSTAAANYCGTMKARETAGDFEEIVATNVIVFGLRFLCTDEILC